MTTALRRGIHKVLFNSHTLRGISTTVCKQSDNKIQYTITTESDGIRTICLNDVKKRNALSLNMLKQIQNDLYKESDGLRVIILTHNGPVFSAGHDLKELTSKEGRDYHAQVFATCSTMMSSLQDLPVPVIAKVSGVATAAGCQLVASCDIAIVTDKSTFATPGVNVGLFCSTPAVAVGRSVPRKVAMEMLFTGNPISAQDALLHGLVSKVVSEDTLDEETMKVANKICETSKSVVAMGKRTFYKQMALDRKQAYQLTETVMVENLSITDGQEGIKAFIEKRKPVWSHDEDKVH
ncbi:Enoyl-CoA hydratase domain-containing protein 3 [Mactra antiquata]